MQSVAAEMNLSETAFLLPEGDGYRLRWFTPAAEVRLCGHATLASAHALWETGRLPLDATARFYTLSGLLTARRNGDWIELNFPARPPQAVDVPALAEALRVKPLATYQDADDYMVLVASEAEVRSLNPDIPAINELPVRGVIVTARSTTPGYDFISRFFAPRVGVIEDPVTGSAHCCLTPYWAAELKKSELVAYQASPTRRRAARPPGRRARHPRRSGGHCLQRAVACYLTLLRRPALAPSGRYCQQFPRSPAAR